MPTTVIWVHSVYGWRDAIRMQEKLLKDLRHKVYAPDLYQDGGRRGPVFNNLEAAQDYADSLGVFDRSGAFEERLEKNKPLGGWRSSPKTPARRCGRAGRWARGSPRSWAPSAAPPACC